MPTMKVERGWGRAFGVLIAILAAIGCARSFAAPSVEGFDLVSSSRSGRTTFNYTYTLRVRADARAYSSGTFTVTSTNTATGVVKGTVALGAVDAGDFVRTADTFVIQQDRLTPFDPSALHFSFAGNVVGTTAGPANLRVGPIVFLEEAGRPGHGGSFPLQGPPTQGTSFMLRAEVYGQVSSVGYSFLDTDGNTLASGPLISNPTGATLPANHFVAPVTVPAQPFSILISASGSDGQPLMYQTAKVFNPPNYSLRIIPSPAVLAPGQSVGLSLQLSSSGASGAFTLTLLLPSGFGGGGGGPWDVTLSPGQTTTVTTNITAPPVANAAYFYTIGASVAHTGTTDPVLYWNRQIAVE